MADDSSLADVPVRGSTPYTSCYCEENVWHFLDRLRTTGGDADNWFAVFVSNENRQTPIWWQGGIDELVVWDYHVIAVRKGAGGAVVCDQDTSLEFPCALDRYVSEAFKPHAPLRPGFQQLLRVVPAADYLARFSSDRSHMFKDGAWLAPPPTYPAIVAPGPSPPATNLDMFIRMDHAEPGYGTVMTPADLLASFTAAP